jgi:DNA polymerase III delta subunit
MRSSAARSRAGSGAAASRPAARGGRRDPSSLLGAVAGGEFPPTVYLDGPSEAVKAALLAEIRAAWAAACPESPLARVFRAAESGVEPIVAAFQGTSLFSPRDLVIALDVEDLGRSEKRVAALAAGIARPLGASCLVLVESAAEQPRKALEPLRAACVTQVACAAPPRAVLLRWGAHRFAREGVAAAAGTVEALADACEGDPLAFFGELDKLCTWAGRGGALTPADVAAVLRPVVGAEVPDYLAAVAAGHAGIATQRLGRLLAAGVGEGTILFSLSNLVSGALGGWARERDISAALRRRSSPEKLARALDAVYRVESAWKGGRVDLLAALEQATRTVCA